MWLAWRGWRGSNPRPLASEANTLSTELQPHCFQAALDHKPETCIINEKEPESKARQDKI